MKHPSADGHRRHLKKESLSEVKRVVIRDAAVILVITQKRKARRDHLADVGACVAWVIEIEHLVPSLRTAAPTTLRP